MEKNNEIRFSSASWFEQAKKTKVQVTGCGGTGSWTALALARAGFILLLYDNDSFTESNLSGQFCKTEDIGFCKTIALKKNIQEFTGNYHNISNSTMNTTETSNHADIVITAVDDIEAREDIFYSFLEKKAQLYIDPRLSFENYQIYTLDKTNPKFRENVENYKNTFFKKDEAYELPCTAKQTTHIAMHLGATIATICTAWVNNQVEEDKRVISYFKEFNAYLL